MDVEVQELLCQVADRLVGTLHGLKAENKLYEVAALEEEVDDSVCNLFGIEI